MPYNVNKERNRYVSGNTLKDGAGTEYRLTVDANGRLIVACTIIGATGAFNPETDDDSIPAGEERSTPNVLLYGYDPVGTDWERVHTDSSHRLLVDAVVTTISAYNPETDDNWIPPGQDRETPNVLLYGYNDLAVQWERIYTDRSHRLLVSVGNWPATQPVSGTFWQATQPVSLATIPAYNPEIEDDLIPAGEVRETVVSLLYGYDDPAGQWERIRTDNSKSLWVYVKNASLAVTGTFYLATQPVSGTVTVQDGGGSLTVDFTRPVPVTDNAGSLTVDGTFWQATQPVSIAVAVAVTGTFWQATQPISVVALPLPAGAATQATLSAAEVHLGNIDSDTNAIMLAVQIMDDWDSGNRCKVEVDQVDAVYNPETDDGQIPDGEVHESVIAVLYAYNTAAADLKRVLVNNSGALMVYTP